MFSACLCLVLLCARECISLTLARALSQANPDVWGKNGGGGAPQENRGKEECVV